MVTLSQHLRTMVQFQQQTLIVLQVGNVNYIDDGNEEIPHVGGSPTISTSGVNAINRVDTVATPSLGAEDFVGWCVIITVGAKPFLTRLTAGEAADINKCSDQVKSQNIHICQMQHRMQCKLDISQVLEMTFA